MATPPEKGRPAKKLLTVLERQQLSNNLLRFVLGGPEMADFPPHQESGYVKLHFNAETGTAIDSHEAAEQAGQTRVRSYTIRAHDPVAETLVLDFALHGDAGPASAWASRAQVGDQIMLAGPGAKKLVDNSADWFFIVGDLTALPAIAVNLEQLPATAKGYAVIEVIDDSDCLPLQLPPGMELHWVKNPHPDQPNTRLPDAVRALPWLDQGRVNVWVACEFEGMRNLRRYFKKERALGRGDVYASCYWKIGDSDEGMKAAKRSDPEADES